MLSDVHFYHRVIRKNVIAFGNMFNNLKMVRYNQAGTTEIERITVPISYASKEKFYKRITEDPTYTQQVQTVLPRMAFSMDGLSYDPLRKISSNMDNFPTSGTVNKRVKFVPYNFDFNLHIFVRNTEDGTQIIEQILPYFAPDYTVKIDFLNLNGLELDVPIVFNSISLDDSYEGDAEVTRVIVWTLNFTLKGYMFGPTTTFNRVNTSIANIYDDSYSSGTYVKLNMADGSGNYQINELVYQGVSVEESSASAFVFNWTGGSSNTLIVNAVSGQFTQNANVIGAVTNARYNLDSFEVDPVELSTLTVIPSPNTANAWDDYGFTTTIVEFPDTL